MNGPLQQQDWSTEETGIKLHGAEELVPKLRQLLARARRVMTQAGLLQRHQLVMSWEEGDPSRLLLLQQDEVAVRWIIMTRLRIILLPLFQLVQMQDGQARLDIEDQYHTAHQVGRIVYLAHRMEDLDRFDTPMVLHTLLATPVCGSMIRRKQPSRLVLVYQLISEV